LLLIGFLFLMSSAMIKDKIHTYSWNNWVYLGSDKVYL
jgi:hypothetical protein